MKLSELALLTHDALQKHGDMEVSVLESTRVPPLSVKAASITTQPLLDGHGYMSKPKLQFVLLP